MIELNDSSSMSITMISKGSEAFSKMYMEHFRASNDTEKAGSTWFRIQPVSHDTVSRTTHRSIQLDLWLIHGKPRYTTLWSVPTRSQRHLSKPPSPCTNGSSPTPSFSIFSLQQTSVRVMSTPSIATPSSRWWCTNRSLPATWNGLFVPCSLMWIGFDLDLGLIGQL